MVAYRAGRSIGLTVLLAAVASAAAQGQDPAPAELTPQAVLKSHNLERSGTTWILLSAEKNVLKDLRGCASHLPPDRRGHDAPAGARDGSTGSQ